MCLSRISWFWKTPVTESNAEEVALTLANIIATSVDMSEAVDIEAAQRTFVNVVNVGSPSPNVSFL